jgi:hypothetical protein
MSNDGSRTLTSALIKFKLHKLKAYFKLLSHHSLGGFEKNHKNLLSGNSSSRPRFESGTSEATLHDDNLLFVCSTTAESCGVTFVIPLRLPAETEAMQPVKHSPFDKRHRD